MPLKPPCHNGGLRVVGATGTQGGLFGKLYEACSRPLSGPLTLPDSLRPLAALLRLNPAPAFVPTSPKAMGGASPNRALVLFSGGKDSTSAALKLRDEGLDVTGFFVRGINRAYPDEIDTARTVARLINLPLKIAEVKQTGRTAQKENPVKNHLLLALAIDHGLRNGYGTYACGNRLDESIEHVEYDCGWSDGIETFRAAKTHFEAACPGVDVRAAVLADKSDTFITLCRYAPQAIVAANGCMLPPYRRPAIIKANRAKYGIDLLPGRCGSCYKCGLEFAMLSFVGALPRNPAFYRHCMECVGKHYAKTAGTAVGDKREPYFDQRALRPLTGKVRLQIPKPAAVQTAALFK